MIVGKLHPLKFDMMLHVYYEVLVTPLPDHQLPGPPFRMACLRDEVRVTSRK